MLVYLYYFVPFYVMVVYSLLVAGCHNMSDWVTDYSKIFAGAAAQVPHSVSLTLPANVTVLQWFYYSLSLALPVRC